MTPVSFHPVPPSPSSNWAMLVFCKSTRTVYDIFDQPIESTNGPFLLEHPSLLPRPISDKSSLPSVRRSLCISSWIPRAR